VLRITTVIAALAATIPAAAAAEPTNARALTYGERVSKKIATHIRGTHLCQRRMDRPRTKVRLLFTRQSLDRRRYVLRVWIDRHDDYCDALRRHRRQRGSLGHGRPPHYAQWLCIHRHEGSWTDSGDPYWGGLQMDRAFMRAYAPAHLLRRGWADTWTPLEQMWVAERAHRTRGFYPWPNTARFCGLI
jgi:hypothetical protein